MKLYATVTSERASKGQGGNKQVTIELAFECYGRQPFGRIVMTHNDGDYEAYFYPIGDVTNTGGRILLHSYPTTRESGHTKHYMCLECGASMSDAGEVLVCDNESCGHNIVKSQKAKNGDN